MVDPAQVNRSLSTIRTELEFLQASNVLNPAQFQSIMAQLPVRFLQVERLRWNEADSWKAKRSTVRVY